MLRSKPLTGWAQTAEWSLLSCRAQMIVSADLRRAVLRAMQWGIPDCAVARCRVRRAVISAEETERTHAWCRLCDCRRKRHDALQGSHGQ
jgi:hypothetical protein